MKFAPATLELFTLSLIEVSWIIHDLGIPWKYIPRYFKILKYLEILFQDFKISRSWNKIARFQDIKELQDYSRSEARILKVMQLQVMEFRWLQTWRFYVRFLLVLFDTFLARFLRHLGSSWKRLILYIVGSWAFKLDLQWRFFLTSNSVCLDRCFNRFFRVFSEIRSLYAYIAGEPRMRIFHSSLKSWNILK